MHRPTSCITKSIDKLRIIDYFSINRNSSISYRVLDDIIYSCTKQGFLVLENHLVDTSLLKDCYTASNLFFDLPKDNKEKYSYLKSDQKKFSNVGYFHLFSEIALGAEYPDNKEFFHIGPKITGKHPLYKVCANNIFPEEIVSFESNYTNLYKSLQDIGNTTLLAIASAFNLDKNYIEKLIKFGNSVLRVVNYPENKGLGLGMRAAPHTGIQLLGIQPPATDRGLELFSQGEWIEISSGHRNIIIINLGEMLSFLLNGEIEPTLHRVTNASTRRQAIIFFYHANPLKNLISHKAGGEVIQAGEWLLKRLREIGIFEDINS